MKKKLIVSILLIGISFSFTGCFASWGNNKAVHGGFLTTNKGKYVVINESGGQIMDVWILKNSYVKSEKDSDGATVVDEEGDSL